jgi:hypothetical protein
MRSGFHDGPRRREEKRKKNGKEARERKRTEIQPRIRAAIPRLRPINPRPSLERCIKLPRRDSYLSSFISGTVPSTRAKDASVSKVARARARARDERGRVTRDRGNEGSRAEAHAGDAGAAASRRRIAHPSPLPPPSLPPDLLLIHHRWGGWGGSGTRRTREHEKTHARGSALERPTSSLSPPPPPPSLSPPPRYASRADNR